jgi:hypothetical protein
MLSQHVQGHLPFYPSPDVNANKMYFNECNYLLVNELSFDIQYCLPASIQFGV